ncbi:MAG: early E1A protein, partial [Oscillospiraceae bacterium]|nr:early E1A protein [Oscillospiraceae bacterium]
MKAHGNGTPETCAANLLHIVRGEVPFDRVRGRDGSLVDRPNAAEEATADAEWVLETYEPRVSVESISD